MQEVQHSFICYKNVHYRRKFLSKNKIVDIFLLQELFFIRSSNIRAGSRPKEIYLQKERRPIALDENDKHRIR